VSLGRVLKKARFSAHQRPAQHPVQIRRRLQLLKKLSNAGRAGREHARPGDADRSVVPGRNAGRPEEQPRLSVGQERIAATPAKDQRYENAYVFGAVCPGRDTGVALIMPYADTEAMQAHLDAIGRAVAPGAHALLILDKAGWHTTRKLTHPAISPLSRCRRHARNSTRPRTSAVSAPDLSRQPCVADYTAILDACQDAWRKLLAETGRITSIAQRDWISIGQSL